MKLLLENWRQYVTENDLNESIEAKILKDIQDGKSLKQIKDRFKFSSPNKERIVDGAYAYYHKPGQKAAFIGDPKKAFNVLFGRKSHKDDQRGVAYVGLGWMATHGGGSYVAHRDDLSDVEGLEDKNNRLRVFDIIKKENPEFMEFLSYAYLIAGTQNNRIVFKELIKRHETNPTNTKIEKVTGSLGVELRSK